MPYVTDLSYMSNEALYNDDMTPIMIKRQPPITIKVALITDSIEPFIEDESKFSKSRDSLSNDELDAIVEQQTKLFEDELVYLLKENALKTLKLFQKYTVSHEYNNLTQYITDNINTIADRASRLNSYFTDNTIKIIECLSFGPTSGFIDNVARRQLNLLSEEMYKMYCRLHLFEHMDTFKFAQIVIDEIDRIYVDRRTWLAIQLAEFAEKTRCYYLPSLYPIIIKKEISGKESEDEQNSEAKSLSGDAG